MIQEIIHVLDFNKQNLLPCSNDEIENLEVAYGLKFPLTYSSFLKSMGKGAGCFMMGSDCFYDTLDMINEEAKLLVRTNGFKDIPQHAFVFWMHQGYQFAFFLSEEGDDPPVYYYNETAKEPDFVRSFNSMSEFYFSELEIVIQAGLVKRGRSL